MKRMSNRIRLLRPDDLLCLEIEPINLVLFKKAEKQWVLQRSDQAAEAFLIVHFPPQAVAEQAFFGDEIANKAINEKVNKKGSYSYPDPPLDPQPEQETVGFSLPIARSRLSGPSRLVFKLPSDPDFQIPYTIEGLLNWETYQLVVTPVAALPEDPDAASIDQAGETRVPNAQESLIEFPYRLMISPNDSVQWGNAKAPVSHEGVTELWHTRLLNKAGTEPYKDLSSANKAPLRAVWSPDYAFKPRTITEVLLDTPPMPIPEFGKEGAFRMSMNGYDRFSIVLNTTAFKGYIDKEENNQPYKPKPFYAEQLLLSPLGAWMRSRGNWHLPTYLRRSFVFKPVPVQWKKDSDIAPGLREKVITYFKKDVAEAPLAVNLIQGIPAKAPTTALSEWVHRATLGRDHYVRIVYEGYLYPFGHRAALIKVTERKIAKVGPTGALYAYLHQRMFIVVREPVKDYTPLNEYTHPGMGTRFERHMPFKNVRLTTLVTPDIVDPTQPGVKIGDFAAWVQVMDNGAPVDFRFHAVGEDFHGHKIDFTAALIFVPADKAPLITENVNVSQAYASAFIFKRTDCLVGNQPVTFVKSAINNHASIENSTFFTDALQFHANEYLEHKEVGYQGFVPFLLSAAIHIPALEQILGTPKPVTIRFVQDYLQNELVNEGKVFAELVNGNGLFDKVVIQKNEFLIPGFDPKSEGVAFTAKQAGGVSTPSYSISCLSENKGPLGGKVQDAQNQTFKPLDYFPKSLGAKLFGVFDLADLLKDIVTFDDNAPKIIRELKPLNGEPTQIIARMEWKPKLGSFEVGIVEFVVKDGTSAEITAEVISMVGPNLAPTSKFEGNISNFDLKFLDVVSLAFKSFKFTSKNGEKVKIDVQLADADPLKFLGDLEFVNEIRKIIPQGLFGDGASLDLTPSSIRAGFSFAVPPVAVGVFALKDITLAAYLTLPFTDGKPTFDFNVSERHKPFVLTVAFFGGGGFFHLQVDTNGVRQLEAALEFGANASIDLGVASGGVHFMAGIYFGLKVDTAGVSSSELTGYLRCGGEVSVLGIVSISIEFCLSFTYYSSGEEGVPGKCKGRATLKISVEILFFSVSVELAIEKGFGGASGDPVFKQVMPEDNIWADYANAFA